MKGTATGVRILSVASWIRSLRESKRPSRDLVVEAAKRGWEAIGVDISERMVQSARESCPEALDPLASFYVGDIRDLPNVVTARLFDAILSVTALQHIPEKELHTVLQGFARVLRQGGILRVDVRIGSTAGYDPDLRFIQSFPDAEPVIEAALEVGFSLEDRRPFATAVGANTFERPIAFQFIELWFVKNN